MTYSVSKGKLDNVKQEAIHEYVSNQSFYQLTVPVYPLYQFELLLGFTHFEEENSALDQIKLINY